MFRDPKTTVCGLILILVVVSFLLGKISMESCVALVGLFAAGIGLTGKDSEKK